MRIPLSTTLPVLALLVLTLTGVTACGGKAARERSQALLESQTGEQWFCQIAEDQTSWDCVQSDLLAAAPVPERMPVPRGERVAPGPASISAEALEVAEVEVIEVDVVEAEVVELEIDDGNVVETDVVETDIVAMEGVETEGVETEVIDEIGEADVVETVVETVDVETLVDETDVAEGEVIELEVDESDIPETEVVGPEVDETDVADMDVAMLEVDDPGVVETDVAATELVGSDAVITEADSSDLTSVELYALPDDAFVVQLVAMRSARTLDNLINDRELTDVFPVRIAVDGEVYHVLVTGPYDDEPSAQEFAAVPPDHLQDFQPWVRSARSLKAAMRAADELSANQTDDER